MIPLFYDANKAAPEILSNDSVFHGLKRAHDYSGIGQVSNQLTKLWAKENPDWDAAAWLTMYNNLVIDAAKTGKLNSYENYPAVHARINKATGGRNGRMPYFFQFSQNARRKEPDKIGKEYKFLKPTQSTMNRISMAFDDIGQINLNQAGVAPFNWQMMLPENAPFVSQEAVRLFCQLDDTNTMNAIVSRDKPDMKEKNALLGFDVLSDYIIHELNALCGDYHLAYAAVLRHLFAGEGLDKALHKQMFWRVFGQDAVAALSANLQACSVCPSCGQKTPNWVGKHVCPKDSKGFYACVDCGEICVRVNSRQCRCEKCQAEYRRINKLANKRMHYQKKR